MAERIAVVETRLDGLEKTVDEVKERVEKISDRTWYILAGVIVSVILALAKLFL